VTDDLIDLETFIFFFAISILIATLSGATVGIQLIKKIPKVQNNQ
jgi:hypothetical protein